MDCQGCNQPFPTNYCWVDDPDCPLEMPPRHPVKSWWQKHWETATVALCTLMCLSVVALAVWEWIVDMNGLH